PLCIDTISDNIGVAQTHTEQGKIESRLLKTPRTCAVWTALRSLILAQPASQAPNYPYRKQV
ncbi:hypothetical protein, partial [Alkalibacillus haloalkaliphilus]|uniref:hypothetical protein n=1 Tax=Alkalibacillus haloalkaliphilus TaxID=94136 RepID=UPI002936364F